MKAYSLLLIPLLTFLSCAGNPEGPCDIYEANGTPCVAAHSTTRLLNSKYDGPLYQLRRDKDGAVLDIGHTKQGYADVAAHEAFTKGEVCFISVIYDQSGMGNDLYQAAPGTFKGPAKGDFNTLPLSDMAPVMVNGHKAYGVYIMPGMGFRNNNARGLAIDDEAEGIYAVVDGTHYSNGCCFDYGNASTNGRAVGTGTMETTYFGTSTAWGRGNGEGPWIMSDFESGLFSGYHHKENDVPSIDSWRFVSIFVNGGGGNQWDLRGADATTEDITTYYKGIRPHSPESNAYYPMSKKGGLLLGNGGDNGNGSAGTFYEGVMTFGYPTDEAIEAVQHNIAAQKYNEPIISQSRLRSFVNNQTQELSVSIKNTTPKAINDFEVFLELPAAWGVEGDYSQAVIEPLLPGEKRELVFEIVAPEIESMGYVTSYVSWGRGNREFAAQRIRSSAPVKINEVLLSNAQGTKDQFIELYNDSPFSKNISGWELVAQTSGKESASILRFADNTIIGPYDFVISRLAPSSLTIDADSGDKGIYLSRDLNAGTKISIDGSSYTISGRGKEASAAATVFTPVSTGPWLEIPAGSTKLPLSSVEGFEPGQKVIIDVDGPQFETATIKKVGKAATQTTLAEAAKPGQTIIKLEVTENLSPGDVITISTGDRVEVSRIKQVISSVSAPVRRPGPQAPPHIPGEVELETPLERAHAAAVDVAGEGSGIELEGALLYAHKSGEAVQCLGLPYELDRPVGKHIHKGTAVVLSGEEDCQPFNNELSAAAGSLILYADDVVVDAIVYGSRQSNSSANGTIAAPEIATLEGSQSQGGCIAVVPQRAFRRPGSEPKAEDLILNLIRYPDGSDKDSLCEDFRPSKTPTPGEANLSQ